MQELVNQLGSKDSRIRDDYAYSELERLIKSNEHTASENKALFNQLISEVSIKGKDTERVLKRSFCALVLSKVIFEDYKRFGVLERGDLREVYEVFEQYLKYEECFIEKDKDLGWVHCHAHIGDVLSTLVIHRNSNLSGEIISLISGFDKLGCLGPDSLERFNAPLSLAKALGKCS